MAFYTNADLNAFGSSSWIIDLFSKIYIKCSASRLYISNFKAT